MYEIIKENALSWIESNLEHFVKSLNIAYSKDTTYKPSAELIFVCIFNNRNNDLRVKVKELLNKFSNLIEYNFGVEFQKEIYKFLMAILF